MLPRLNLSSSNTLVRGLEALLRWCRKAADQGHSSARLFNLGVMYNQGFGLAQNHAVALRWYRKAADQGNASAQYYLGTLYQRGLDVVQNYAEALRWYHRPRTKAIL